MDSAPMKCVATARIDSNYQTTQTIPLLFARLADPLSSPWSLGESLSPREHTTDTGLVDLECTYCS